MRRARLPDLHHPGDGIQLPILAQPAAAVFLGLNFNYQITNLPIYQILSSNAALIATRIKPATNCRLLSIQFPYGKVIFPAL